MHDMLFRCIAYLRVACRARCVHQGCQIRPLDLDRVCLKASQVLATLLSNLREGEDRAGESVLVLLTGLTPEDRYKANGLTQWLLQ